MNWVPIFSSGISIVKEDQESILIELEKVSKWAEENLDLDVSNQMKKRIALAKQILVRAFGRADAKVFVG